jgi:hypothetical protein
VASLALAMVTYPKHRCPGVRVFVTTLAPMTFPYLLKISFKSVARVRDDKPETHKLRLNAALLVPFVGDGAVIFVLTVVMLLVVVELVADEVAEGSGISAIIRTENRKLIFNSFFSACGFG